MQMTNRGISCHCVAIGRRSHMMVLNKQDPAQTHLTMEDSPWLKILWSLYLYRTRHDSISDQQIAIMMGAFSYQSKNMEHMRLFKNYVWISLQEIPNLRSVSQTPILTLISPTSPNSTGYRSLGRIFSQRFFRDMIMSILIRPTINIHRVHSHFGLIRNVLWGMSQTILLINLTCIHMVRLKSLGRMWIAQMVGK